MSTEKLGGIRGHYSHRKAAALQKPLPCQLAHRVLSVGALRTETLLPLKPTQVCLEDQLPGITSELVKNAESWGFPGGSVVKSLPANAGDMGLILGWGKIPHASEQLSLGATSVEPVLLSPGAATTEAPVPWRLCSSKRAPTAAGAALYSQLE